MGRGGVNGLHSAELFMAHDIQQLDRGGSRIHGIKQQIIKPQMKFANTGFIALQRMIAPSGPQNIQRPLVMDRKEVDDLLG